MGSCLARCLQRKAASPRKAITENVDLIRATRFPHVSQQATMTIMKSVNNNHSDLDDRSYAEVNIQKNITEDLRGD